MKLGYDMHIATEAGNSSKYFKEKLIDLGFKDDNLAQKGLIFDTETAKYYECCPLIDIHVSKKVPTHPELREIEVEVHKIMNQSGLVGYWHSECILEDGHYDKSVEFELKPLPFKRLLSQPRDDEKVWDIHISFRERSVPESLGKVLIENGIYYLARLKRVPEGGEDRFSVYTVQGVNSLKQGRMFYMRMCEWLQSIGAPSFDIKLELTTAMRLYNKPSTVPPTINNIVWV